jgi:hypothetical protein
MATQHNINWLNEPEEHDYTAARSYLSLLYAEKIAKVQVKELKREEISEFNSKDIFRAASLPLLAVSNSHVRKEQRKIEAKQSLSPLLLLRDSSNGKVVIADGYHRLCAVYSFDEDALIPCKIINA